MTKSILVLVAMLAVAGCMTSYPMWDPPPVESGLPTSGAATAVTIEGRVAEIDHDENSIEVETEAEGAESWVTVELDERTTVFSSAARDESARGTEGLDLLEEDDSVTVTGMKRSDDSILAREISLVGNEVTSVRPPPAAPMYEPRTRVAGTVRSIDTSIGRFVLETEGNGLVAFYCDGDTPVFFNGVIYQIVNLEVGDGVEVTIGATDEGDPATPWVTAIEVTRSVSHDGRAPAPPRIDRPVAEPDVKLETIEITGTVRRVEAQGFEIEVEAGELRYVTADPEMRTECGEVNRVGKLKAGMSISVRALEVGNRVVAQQIKCVSH